MPISQRLLTKWRREALISKTFKDKALAETFVDVFSKRILVLTQELLDQHLLRKEAS